MHTIHTRSQEIFKYSQLMITLICTKMDSNSKIALKMLKLLLSMYQKVHIFVAGLLLCLEAH